ncbi:SDR family oxidoreductase [Haloechinothrix sp. LS1_15]|uniref:SDR family NAD(P)-dependent oxidoreductase n=1 Tax=Haloechinothrix sp. LS1_15 TaxID=2652248 RepID=UPI00294479E6|nr:SDR family oxidoreductase [Haloechinothrix sp. LS1_15]MDV6014264.1 SDR family oxidoreductase [Haloechinothrix sp. LS1_15]
MGRFDGKRVLITGGARGIGTATARGFAEEGAEVFIADVLDDEGRAVAAEIQGARFVHLDVTVEADWRAALEEVHLHGPLDVLVNNAGVLEFGSIAEQDPKSFHHVLEINLYGPWLGMHVAADSLRAAKGVVVNISSIAGMMGYSNLGAYVASKWGLRGLTKTAALELATSHVRVCSIHPGPIRTPMTSVVDESIAGGQPIPRFGSPEEVASMVLYFAGEATYSTGTEFVVDGGATVGSVALADVS